MSRARASAVVPPANCRRLAPETEANLRQFEYQRAWAPARAPPAATSLCLNAQ